MTRAYDKCYLEDTMSSLGAMLDFAVGTCGEDLKLFWERFLSSGIAQQFSRRNPKYLCGLSGIELALRVAEKTGAPLPVKNLSIDIGSPAYWTGWSLAYLQWYLNLSFMELQRCGLTAAEVHSRYSTLHEADPSRTVLYAEKVLAAHHNPKAFKQARKNAGLNQRQLAERSGIPLRVIRAYEQGTLSLDRAAAQKVRLLYSVLGLDGD